MKLVLFTSLAFKGWKKMSMRLVTGISMVFLLFSVAIACSTSQPIEKTATSNINAAVDPTTERKPGSANPASTSNITATIGPIVEHKQGSAECITSRHGQNVACGGQAAECITSRHGQTVACGGDPQWNPNRKGPPPMQNGDPSAGGIRVLTAGHT